METRIVELSADISARNAKRWRVDYVGNESNPPRKLVVCKTKAAAQQVQDALANPDVLWPVD